MSLTHTDLITAAEKVGARRGLSRAEIACIDSAERELRATQTLGPVTVAKLTQIVGE